VALFLTVPRLRSAGIRILGLLRLWRLLRLMHTMLAKKDDEVERTNDLWQTDQQALEAARLQIAQLEDSVRREVDSKKRIEQMLKSYKDEVSLWFISQPPRLPPSFPLLTCVRS
jgi:septal ring factor EnvC (AmiA/AmiB activator)